MKVTMLFRFLILIFISSLISIYARGSGGSIHVNGYYRSNGTYVAPHYRSSPDGDFSNNWSTKGNINPYTGKEGTKTIDPNLHSYGSDSNMDTSPSYNIGENNKNSLTNSSVDTNNTKEIKIPKHAKLNYFGNGWECIRGYYQSGNTCEPVQVPENGKLDYFGHQWECERGYAQMGRSCKMVQVPKNGKLDYFGHSWECERGFVKAGDNCKTVLVPDNGKLDYFGHDWECQRGYQRSGNTCKEVIVPINGKLNYFGNDWECSRGFVRSGSQCLQN